MKQPDRFLFNLALCLEELDISHSGLGLLMQDFSPARARHQSGARQTRQRSEERGAWFKVETDAHLRDIEAFGRVLEIDPAVLAFGNIGELRAALYHEE